VPKKRGILGGRPRSLAGVLGKGKGSRSSFLKNEKVEIVLRRWGWTTLQVRKGLLST